MDESRVQPKPISYRGPLTIDITRSGSSKYGDGQTIQLIPVEMEAVACNAAAMDIFSRRCRLVRGVA
jgi:hypothetical protein